MQDWSPEFLGVGAEPVTEWEPHRFEVRLLRVYLANAAAAKLSSSAFDRTLSDWLEMHGETAVPELLRACGPPGGNVPLRVLAMLRRLPGGERAPAPSPLEKRLRWIAATLGLCAADAAILKLAVRVALLTPVRALAAAVSHEKVPDRVGLSAFVMLLRRSHHELRGRLRPRRPLMQLGLLEGRGGEDYAPSALVLRLARTRWTDPDRLRGELFGEAPPATLAWDDFAHLGEGRDLGADLVEAALKTRAPGIGVLLYGAPGTGKTEFAKTLAARLGAAAVFIGETDDVDGEPSRAERIAHFAFTSTLAGKAGRALLVVDEADDIFTGVDEDDRASRTGSKVFMNRLVERCAAPTLWITNSPERLGPAVMRRMALAIAFRAPGRAVRRRVAARLAETNGLALPDAALDRLARVDTAPALIGAGLRAAALTGGDIETALRSTGSLLAAMGDAPRMPALGAELPFDPDLSAADHDLAALAARAFAAHARGETALSFCLYGLPGTGKSAYARFVAEKLGIEVIEKRASDLLSMFLGGSEKAIAAAFAEAADRRAMLILDEADSLLRDRTGAARSWEVTQVNEMLTWMERHPHPFACTTNAMDALDPATLRRFLFKVEFKPMTEPQARETFVRTFAVEPPEGLARLDPLTPGDFALVGRKARVMGERDAGRLVAMLAAEVAAKPGAGRVRMGF